MENSTFGERATRSHIVMGLEDTGLICFDPFGSGDFQLGWCFFPPASPSYVAPIRLVWFDPDNLDHVLGLIKVLVKHSELARAKWGDRLTRAMAPESARELFEEAIRFLEEHGPATWTNRS